MFTVGFTLARTKERFSDCLSGTKGLVIRSYDRNCRHRRVTVRPFSFGGIATDLNVGTLGPSLRSTILGCVRVNSKCLRRVCVGHESGCRVDHASNTAGGRRLRGVRGSLRTVSGTLRVLSQSNAPTVKGVVCRPATRNCGS